MIKFLFFILLVIFSNTVLSLLNLLNNEWYSISYRNLDCQNPFDLNCLLKIYKKTLRFGIWYICPIESPNSLTWITDKYVVQSCMFLKPMDSINKKSKFPGIIATWLNNNFFLDIEPNLIVDIQILFVFGNCCLILAMVFTLSILIYLILAIDKQRIKETSHFCKPETTVNPSNPEGLSENFKLTEISMMQKERSNVFHSKLYDEESINFKYNSFKIYLTPIFILVVLELASRSVSFYMFSLNSESYLNDIIRRSFSSYYNVDFYQNGFDIFVENISINYHLNRTWSYWLCLVSILLSALTVLLLSFYVLFNELLNAFNKRQEHLQIENLWNNLAGSNDSPILNHNNLISIIESNKMTIDKHENNHFQNDQNRKLRSIQQVNILNHGNWYFADDAPDFEDNNSPDSNCIFYVDCDDKIIESLRRNYEPYERQLKQCSSSSSEFSDRSIDTVNPSFYAVFDRVILKNMFLLEKNTKEIPTDYLNIDHYYTASDNRFSNTNYDFKTVVIKEKCKV